MKLLYAAIAAALIAAVSANPELTNAPALQKLSCDSPNGSYTLYTTKGTDTNPPTLYIGCGIHALRKRAIFSIPSNEKLTPIPPPPKPIIFSIPSNEKLEPFPPPRGRTFKREEETNVDVNKRAIFSIPSNEKLTPMTPPPKPIIFSIPSNERLTPI
ncbi:hypothetical protein HDU97_001147 [Phlyctochytrium planicorne]|nr:hypothetical protein HDU97_001147 [Phlyctochytrium planicorne]